MFIALCIAAAVLLITCVCLLGMCLALSERIHNEKLASEGLSDELRLQKLETNRLDAMLSESGHRNAFLKRENTDLLTFNRAYDVALKEAEDKLREISRTSLSPAKKAPKAKASKKRNASAVA